MRFEVEGMNDGTVDPIIVFMPEFRGLWREVLYRKSNTLVTLVGQPGLQLLMRSQMR